MVATSGNLKQTLSSVPFEIALRIPILIRTRKKNERGLISFLLTPSVYSYFREPPVTTRVTASRQVFLKFPRPRIDFSQDPPRNALNFFFLAKTMLM